MAAARAQELEQIRLEFLVDHLQETMADAWDVTGTVAELVEASVPDHRADLVGGAEALRKAISIGDRTFPVAGGAFRGSLALLLAKQDQLEQSQTLLDTGELQVENYPEEHAKFLCKKGQVCHIGGDAEGVDARRRGRW